MAKKEVIPSQFASSTPIPDGDLSWFKKIFFIYGVIITITLLMTFINLSINLYWLKYS